MRAFSVYKREQARISRRSLYRVTAFYSCYAVIILVLAVRAKHPLISLLFLFTGVLVWTLVEYSSHRFIFHAHFQISESSPFKKFYTGLANKYLDPLHWGHHERPFDGEHINGDLKDLVPLFVVAAPLSFIFPVYTAPLLLAGVVQSYVAEEWLHHCMHFYNPRIPYFQHLKRYHIYHHTSAGIKGGFGISSALWDVVFHTRYPAPVRERLFGRRNYTRLAQPDNQPTSRIPEM
jgi:sterol desaturase/sphingolipid hydroxylase (fatty acid hydroxylase superfamily)